MELGKVRITIFVAISGSVGYIIANNGTIDMTLFFTALGIFILSVGASAFNHIQEIPTDSLMYRTKNRPLPTQSISEFAASLWALLFVVIGSLILLFGANFEAFAFGICTLIAYNLVYTPLKKLSAFAIMPGAIVGALPPAIGWVAGGGSISDPKLLALTLFFFIWQIPHFWFLLLIFDEDYKRAGFPTLSKYFSQEQLKRITYIWVVALAASCMMIPLFGLTHNLFTNLLLLFAGFVLAWRTKMLVLKYDRNLNFRMAFLDINIYVLTVVVLLSIDQFIH
jgi:protoheme IX farnesyltransferase